MPRGKNDPQCPLAGGRSNEVSYILSKMDLDIDKRVQVSQKTQDKEDRRNWEALKSVFEMGVLGRDNHQAIEMAKRSRNVWFVVQADGIQNGVGPAAVVMMTTNNSLYLGLQYQEPYQQPRVDFTVRWKVGRTGKDVVFKLWEQVRDIGN